MPVAPTPSETIRLNRLRPLLRVLHHICQCPRRVRRQYIVNPRKSNVPGPFPLRCPALGRSNAMSRVFSGCSLSPNRSIRLPSTSATRCASSRRSNPMTKSSRRTNRKARLHLALEPHIQCVIRRYNSPATARDPCGCSHASLCSVLSCSGASTPTHFPTRSAYPSRQNPHSISSSLVAQTVEERLNVRFTFLVHRSVQRTNRHRVRIPEPSTPENRTPAPYRPLVVLDCRIPSGARPSASLGDVHSPQRLMPVPLRAAGAGNSGDSPPACPYCSYGTPIHPQMRQCAVDDKARSSGPVEAEARSEWNRPSGSLRSSDVDMSSINASAMFPQLRLTPARAAFARPGPHATAFPDGCSPPTPSSPSAAAPVVPRQRPCRSSPPHRCLR